MIDKSAKTTSKKIEKKITLVTSILGMIIVNIIWVAGINESEPAFQPSLTKKEIKEEVKDKEVSKFPVTVSLSHNNASMK